MADFKESTFDGVKIGRAAITNDDAMRKGEFDTAIENFASVSQMESAIESLTHPPASAEDVNASIVFSFDSGQQLTGEVKLLEPSTLQVALSGRTQTFNHPVAANQTLQLDRNHVSNFQLQRKDSGNTVLSTGVLGTDYTIDSYAGQVFVLPGSNLITIATQKVVAVFDCALVKEGPGLGILNGIHAVWGTDHDTIARGDHQHANDHVAVSADATFQTATVSINPKTQKLRVDVRLAAVSGLTVVSGGSGGLAVDFGQVSAIGHGHGLVNGSAAGFMSPAMLSALTAAASNTTLTFVDTASIHLDRDEDGIVTASVIAGLGIIADDNDGLTIDFDEVARAGHVHNTVGGIYNVLIIDGGTDYTDAPLSFNGGGGTGAAALVVLAAGVIIEVQITNQGQGYVTAPEILIGGDGIDAELEAQIWNQPGFLHQQTFADILDARSRLATAESSIATLITAVSLRATIVQLNDGLALKANLSHTHVIGDVTGLQAALDDKSDSDHTHAIVTADDPGFMSSEMLDDFNCLKHLENEKEAALLFMPVLRLECPSLNGGGTTCPLTLAADAEAVSGTDDKTYNVHMHVRGCVEIKAYTGGTTLNGGRVNVDGTPASNPHNIWKLIVSDPAHTYYLNAVIGAESPASVHLLDYIMIIPVQGGATVTLQMDSNDNLQTMVGIAAVPGIPPYPALYSGQLLQIDAEKIEDYCLLDITFGGEIQTIGGGQTPTNTPQNGAPPGGPLQIVQQINRLDLVEDGEANGEVREILVDGDNIWVGGKFSRFHNVDAWCLIKLDQMGRINPFYNPGTGFSQPIDYIRAHPAGGVYVGSILDALCQGSSASRPVWKIKEDGSVDAAFTAPFVLNEFGGVSHGVDKLLSIDVLASGKVAVLAPEKLTVLSETGAVFYEAVGSAQFNSILAVEDKLLLSSHAWSTALVPQDYKGIYNPKGLKLLNMGADSILRIAAIGDFGTNSSQELQVSTAIKDVIQPEHLLMLGDNNYETGSQGTIDINIGKYFRPYIFPYVGSQPLLTGEFDAVSNRAWPCIGNHDAGNVVNATANARTNPDALPGDLDYQIVTGIDLKNRGAAYRWPPTVGFSGGGGTGAAADATLQGSTLKSLTLSAAHIVAVDVAQGGAGYSVAPTVQFSGGGGTGAAATAVVSAGAVTTINVTSAGSGYTSTPSVTLIPVSGGSGAVVHAVIGTGTGYSVAPIVGIAGGGGSGASATATVRSGAVTGFVYTDFGTGYTDERTIVVGFTPVSGGSGAAAVGHIWGSPISSLAMTAGGTGYTSAPTVAITDGGIGLWSITPHLNYFTLPGNERTYTFSLGDADFFVLNSDLNEPDGITESDPSGPWHRVTSKQALWLRDRLSQSTARWKFVYFHHTIAASFDWDTDTDQTGVPSPPYWMDWGSAYADWGADFVLSGHIHQFEHIQRHGIDYFNVGGGGKDIRPYSATLVSGGLIDSHVFEFGAMQIDIGHDSVRMCFVDRFGVIRYDYTKTKAATPDSFGEIDPVWELASNAGTGAMSSCNRAVVDPEEEYFIVGNALTNFNSPNTSWNAEMAGNILLHSQEFSDPTWVKIGSPLVVTEDFADSPESVPTMTADQISDNDGVDLAYIYQDVSVTALVRYAFSIYIQKDSDTTRFPLLRLEYRGGTATNDSYVYLNTQTGDRLPGGTITAGNFTVAVEDIGTYWRVTLRSTNSKSATSVRCYAYPAYSNVFGSPAVSLTGSIIAWGAQLRPDNWDATYIATDNTPITPAGNAPNSDQYRGLYKIRMNGVGDPDWNVNLTFSEPGWAIPFAIDAEDRLYFGGPILSINGTTVTPWRIYRLTINGDLDRTYEGFNDRVLVARLNKCAQLVVGGRFTAYGQKKIGRFMFLNPDGTVAEDCCDTSPLIQATPPDVLENPCFMDRVWVNIGMQPPMLHMYSKADAEWKSICELCAVVINTRLPAPDYDPPTGIVPLSVRLFVPGYPNAKIRYTLDGTAPSTTNGALYNGPLTLTVTTTIRAYAFQVGFEDSDISEATYQDATYQQCDPVTFDPLTGAVVPVDVLLSCATAGALIRYTIDGSTPTAVNGIDFTGTPISVVSPTTIKAYASKMGYADSIVTQANYVSPASVFAVVNLQFRNAANSAKVGPAAVGDSGDLWNHCYTSEFNLSSLKFGDGSTSTANFLRTVPAAEIYEQLFDNLRPDNLRKYWQRFYNQAAAQVHAWSFKLMSLPPGKYDLYLYHSLSTAPVQFSLARRRSNGATLESLQAQINQPSLSEPGSFVIDQHYCKFSNVTIAAAGEFFEIVVLNGELQGLQLAYLQANNPPRLPEVIAVPPTGSASPVAGGVILKLPSNIQAPYKIHYETDATNPPNPNLSSPLYTAPIPVSADQVIRAFAEKSGYLDGPISTFIYSLIPALPELPDFLVTGLTGVPYDQPGEQYFVFTYDVNHPLTFGLLVAFRNPAQDPGGVSFQITELLNPGLGVVWGASGALLVTIHTAFPNVGHPSSITVRARKAGYQDRFTTCQLMIWGI